MFLVCFGFVVFLLPVQFLSNMISMICLDAVVGFPVSVYNFQGWMDVFEEPSGWDLWEVSCDFSTKTHQALSRTPEVCQML